MPDGYFADLSSNNGPVFDAHAYASAGHRVVSLKATEDTGYVNPYYAGWCEAAHAAGLAVIHYHFARPENGNPQGQAEHFWNTVQPHWRHLPGDHLAIDLETDAPSVGKAWLDQCDAKLRAVSDKHPWVYCPYSYFISGGITVASRLIWVAAWGSQRPGDWRWRLPNGQFLVAWQYSDGQGYGPGPQSFAGIPNRCDGSLLNPGWLKEYTKKSGQKPPKVTKVKHKQCHC